MKIETLQGHNNPIYTVIAHPQVAKFYSAGNDKGIVEWDIATKLHSRLFKQVSNTIYTLEIIEPLNLLIAGCSDGNILFFDLDTTELKFSISVEEPVFNLHFNDLKHELIASTANGKIVIINPDSQKILHQFQSGKEKIRSFTFNEKQNLLVTASNDKKLRIYRLDDYTLITEFEAHTMGVGAVSFSPDGQYLITGSRDAHLKAWKTNTWTEEYKFPAHLFAIYRICYHPQLPYLATASRDKSVKIWRTEDFSLYRNLSIDKGLDGHRLSVNDICWSADGKYLISVSDDKLVKLWDFESYKDLLSY